jgi:hypothetical protein
MMKANNLASSPALRQFTLKSTAIHTLCSPAYLCNLNAPEEAKPDSEGQDDILARSTIPLARVEQVKLECCYTSYLTPSSSHTLAEQYVWNIQAAISQIKIIHISSKYKIPIYAHSRFQTTVAISIPILQVS